MNGNEATGVPNTAVEGLKSIGIHMGGGHLYEGRFNAIDSDVETMTFFFVELLLVQLMANTPNYMFRVMDQNGVQRTLMLTIPRLQQLKKLV